MSTSDSSPTLTLARELIQRTSVTPEDAGCQQLLANRLEALGFRCEHLRFGEGEEHGPVDNLWAIKEGSAPQTERRTFCFAGHTDVVPVGERADWNNDPFAADIEGDMLVGRGAADMKGSLAAMVTATEAFLQSNPDHTHNIAWLITSDEEGPAVYGTVKVVEYLQANNEPIHWCLVGEPSSTERVGDVVKNGRRGSLNGKLIVKGVQGHVAYPQLADNPIHKALAALQALSAKQWDQGNEFFPPTSFQISNIHSGTGATNVIPGNLEVLFNFRYSTQWTADNLQAESLEILHQNGLQAQDYELKWNNSGNPFITESGELVDATAKAIKSVTGRNTELLTTGGTSDGRFIAPTGSQVVELGPVNATIHKVDECVSINDLNQLHSIYEQILCTLLT